MIVEDDYLIAGILEEMLRELGYADILHVDSVSGALAALAASPPALVFLDANLRGEISHRVARTLGERGIPFVVGSGHDVAALPADFQRGVPMLKPYTVPLLVGALTRALGGGA